MGLRVLGVNVQLKMITCRKAQRPPCSILRVGTFTEISKSSSCKNGGVSSLSN